LIVAWAWEAGCERPCVDDIGRRRAISTSGKVPSATQEIDEAAVALEQGEALDARIREAAARGELSLAFRDRADRLRHLTCSGGGVSVRGTPTTGRQGSCFPCEAPARQSAVRLPIASRRGTQKETKLSEPEAG
jgi:hypothetical protein